MRISMTVAQKEIYVKADVPCLFYLDMDAFKSAIEKLSKVQYQIESYTESSFDGSISTLNANQTILTTIPYDEGWNIYLDGERVDYYKTLNALIAFDIEDSGEHTLTMKYMPKAFVIGAACSIVCILLFVLLCVFDVVLKKKKNVALQGSDENEQCCSEEYELIEANDGENIEALSQNNKENDKSEED